MKKTLLALLAAALAGCGSTASSDRSRAPPTLGAPIAGLAAGQWSFVAFPDAVCGDGSATGIGIYPGSGDLLVYHEGGGACWNWGSCQIPGGTVSTLGPFGAPQLTARMAAVAGSIFDRGDATNPFKDFTYVYVPYCTGDVHAGDNQVTYVDAGHTPPGPPLTVSHRGHANVVAYLARLAATYAAPTRIVISGSSAGGFGTTSNYDTYRLYWPTQKMYLLDDAGSSVPGIPAAEIYAWYANWNLGASLDGFCPACRVDLSQGYAALAHYYPGDRMSLLSYTQDATIRSFFLMSGPQFEANLRAALAAMDHTPSWSYFVVTGSVHTLLRDLDNHVSEGVTLKTYLAKQIGDDPTWAKVLPPP